MRVIGGAAKGRKLAPLKGDEIRPTLDKVREALFNILGPRLEGALFLDLFAGTGANGIEALSRGAHSCVFVDNDRSARELIAKNVEITNVAAQSTITGLTLPQGLPRLAKQGLEFDIIFADPPYTFSSWEDLLQSPDIQTLLSKNGVLVCEHKSSTDIAQHCAVLEQIRTVSYGDSALSLWQLPSN